MGGRGAGTPKRLIARSALQASGRVSMTLLVRWHVFQAGGQVGRTRDPCKLCPGVERFSSWSLVRMSEKAAGRARDAPPRSVPLL